MTDRKVLENGYQGVSSPEDGRSPAPQGRAATPSGPSPKRVSGIAGIPNAWRAGPIKIAFPQGPKLVAGWIYGDLAIDARRRVNGGEGWAITHLPTGFSAGVIEGFLMKAVQFVETAHERADWSFTDPEDAQKLAMLVKDLASELGVRREQVTGYHRPEGFPASVGRHAKRHDPAEGRGPQDEHAVGSEADETPNSPSDHPGERA